MTWHEIPNKMTWWHHALIKQYRCQLQPVEQMSRSIKWTYSSFITFPVGIYDKSISKSKSKSPVVLSDAAISISTAFSILCKADGYLLVVD